MHREGGQGGVALGGGAQGRVGVVATWQAHRQACYREAQGTGVGVVVVLVLMMVVGGGVGPVYGGEGGQLPHGALAA